MTYEGPLRAVGTGTLEGSHGADLSQVADHLEEGFPSRRVLQ